MNFVFQFEVVYSNKTIAIQRTWIKSEVKKYSRASVIFFHGHRIKQGRGERNEREKRKLNYHQTRHNYHTYAFQARRER